jgi:polysaccharide deacetylase family protein (PEP-CTERM system associated)
MKILTFDIEEWFHILDNPQTRSMQSWGRFPSRLMTGVESILSLLDETHQKATFYCLGWVAEKHPEAIKLIHEAGFDIGTHSYAHQLAYDQDRDSFREDLHKSIVILQDIIGKPIESYRAPGFSITTENLWAFEILLEEGIKIDSSLFPANRAHGGLPGFETVTPSRGYWGENHLKLFPINTKSFLGRKFIYSGGGYFRLFPRTVIQGWFGVDDYVMTYFHPRDFDPGQPLVPGLSPGRRFKSYVGIKGARNKLKAILEQYRFTDVPTAVRQVDWDKAPSVDLKTGKTHCH